MEFENEIWKMDYGLYKLYTDKRSVINRVIKITGNEVSGTYYKKGKEFGWDILVETKHLPEVKRSLREFKKR
jgi:hypothetical protein